MIVADLLTQKKSETFFHFISTESQKVFDFFVIVMALMRTAAEEIATATVTTTATATAALASLVSQLPPPMSKSRGIKVQVFV